MADAGSFTTADTAAHAMLGLALGAAVVGVLFVRARERPGGIWLLGWSTLLASGGLFLLEDAGRSFVGPAALLAEAIWPPLMLMGVLALDHRARPAHWLPALGLGAGLFRILCEALSWEIGLLVLALSFAPFCFAAATREILRAPDEVRLRLGLAALFGGFFGIEIWDGIGDWLRSTNRVPYEVVAIAGLPLAALQVGSRVMALREGIDSAQRTTDAFARRRDLERDHFHRIFDEIRELVAELDEETRVLFVNQRVRDLLGLEPDDVIGHRALDFVPLEHRFTAEAVWQAQLGEGGVEEPVVFPMPDTHGGTVFLEITVSSRYLGEQRRLLVLARDVTHRHEAEERLDARRRELEERVATSHDQLRASRNRLHDQERLAAVGTLASGLAHQINNPLGAIVAASDFALLESGRGDRVAREALERIGEEARRAGRIVKSVLRFARQGDTPKWVDDLVPVVRRSVELTRSYVQDRGGKLGFEGPVGRLDVLMSPIEIEQVVVNLVRNAAESKPSGAHVVVRVRADESASSALIEVIDDGDGIPPDAMEEIFDPFFTTRLNDGGSGLGLSVVHGIVDEHGGEIGLSSELGRGTTVRVRLALRPSAAGGSDPSSA